jgi:hypothetical protein
MCDPLRAGTPAFAIAAAFRRIEAAAMLVERSRDMPIGRIAGGSAIVQAAQHVVEATGHLDAQAVVFGAGPDPVERLFMEHAHVCAKLGDVARHGRLPVDECGGGADQAGLIALEVADIG